MPIRSAVDAVAYSSLLAAAIGFALSCLSSLSLAAPSPAHWASLTATGTFIIYNLDRLRDISRDHQTSPQRTAFIEQNRARLTLSVAAASIVFGGLLVSAPQPIIALCGSIGVVGFFHRRIKSASAFKALYVSVAWVTACIGIPWLAAAQPPFLHVAAWSAGILLPTLVANLVASNLRDDETQLLPARPEVALRVARWLSFGGVVIAALAPASATPLGWVAAAQGAALLRFKKSERYGHVVIDGALLAGAALAALHFCFVGER